MGIYLYGIKKLKKAQRVVREDGEVRVVAHCLAYVSKPFWGFNGPSDRYTRLALGRLDHLYPGGFRGPVVYGDNIIDWDGSAAWYDGGDLPEKCVRWGRLTDLVDRDDETKVTFSKAVYAPARIAVLREGATQQSMYTLHRVLTVVHPQTRYQLATHEVYGVRLPTGIIEFRGGFYGTTRMDGADPARVMAHWDGYCRVNEDALLERTPIVYEAPKAPVAKPEYDHEASLQAAGWL